MSLLSAATKKESGKSEIMVEPFNYFTGVRLIISNCSVYCIVALFSVGITPPIEAAMSHTDILSSHTQHMPPSMCT